MELYCGIDLHSTNNVVAILNRDLECVGCRRLRNDLKAVLAYLEPYREDIVTIAVESTYNWYWLVDGLKEAGYDVRLVNTTKASNYNEMKYTDDNHDARWIARLQALKILPEGYITPPEDRGIRDLLRRRSFLVEKRTAHLLSLRALFERSTGKRVDSDLFEGWSVETVRELIQDPWAAECVTVMLPVVRVLTRQICTIEKSVLAVAKLRPEFELLKTVPGIGDVLALTIMCETVDISRFAKVGNYVSYCRAAKSEHTSNQKKKGVGNRKNGNKYLSWAYSEVAQHTMRYEPLAARYYARKRSRSSHPMVAKRALAAKMARACYYVLRDQTPFDADRVFHR
jgi:transposase